ncbi:hypothetical protein [Stratiformator vulcanicus]|uniref:Uncharacterized protein n=1 Tax=Stratiformator vulcanicus TaxID=2527980 RepID=A0A517QX74_9PLAN|nr:hypothetical protein [Stratiformator vulcanicus]QDT36262.1 hypothetical protein Pan189_06180 [Stratiformator vulcanicus]
MNVRSWIGIGILVAAIAYLATGVITDQVTLKQALYGRNHSDVRLQFLGIEPDDAGSIVKYRIRNDPYEPLVKLKLAFEIKPFPAPRVQSGFGSRYPHPGFDFPLRRAVSFEDLGRGESRTFTLSVKNYRPKHLLGWEAKVASFERRPDRWFWWSWGYTQLEVGPPADRSGVFPQQGMNPAAGRTFLK